MRTLTPPRSLESDFFVLIWDREEDVFILSLPDGRSYELGNAQSTLIYFNNVLQLGMLGERAMDSARNWYTSIVIPKDNRCFRAETKESQTDYQRLFQTEPDPFAII